MMLNKKGITLIEIIISIALISIVLIFLFSLLINVNDMNKEADVNSTYLINKALILKNIEEDLKNKEEITITKCAQSIYSNYKPDELDTINKGYECIEINYGDNDIAKLGIYYYNNKRSYVISYIHDSIKATRVLPDFDSYNINKEEGTIKQTLSINRANTSCNYNNSTGLTKTCNSNTENKDFYIIKIPIIGMDSKDYTILISYYGKLIVK